MSAAEFFWAAPPVSRTITALTLVTSALCYGGLLSFERVLFILPRVFKFPIPEVWRLATAFWLTGPKLSIIFDTVFLWQYSKALETESPRFSQPGDFFTYVVFLELVIVALAGGILRSVAFTNALILGLAYTFAQDNPTKKVSLFIVSFKAMYLPWALLGFTFIMAGPDAVLSEFTGLIAAHLYEFLTRLWPNFGGGRNPIKTPRIVQKWFGADQRGVKSKGYGTAFTPASQTPSQASTTGFSFNSWSQRGQGRRLGGD